MRTHKIEHAPMVRLGELIEIVNNPNREGILYPYYGINKDKEFMPTVANTDGLDPSKYTKLEKGMFVFSGMQTGRDVCIRIALFDSDNPVLISPAYTTFKIINADKVIPKYFFIFFKRFEMDRMGWFLSDSSIRSNLDWDRFCEIQIPLPSIETQKELVAVYNGLKELAEENEKLLEPLEESCHAFIVDCKNKYESKLLKNYIEEVNERNINNEISLTQGVDVNMQFIPAKREAENKEGTKIVRTGQFAFNKVVKAGGTKLPIAFRTGPDCIISSSYAVFKNINTEELLSEYLMLWMSRSEFHRYCGFMSQGTTRDVFDFSDLSSLKIPVPPMDIQQKIVDLYNCYEECKRISTETREKIKNLCPALVQKAVNSN